MKKSLLLAGLLSVSSLMSADIKPFVGLDLSNATVDTSLSATLTAGTITDGTNTYAAGDTASVSYDEDDTAPVVKAGVIVDNSHRVYLKYGKFDYELESDLKLTTLNYDYLINFNNSYDLTPYVGFHLGHGKATVANAISESGMAYGVQTGIIVPIINSLEFELGMNYTNTDIKNTVSGSIADQTSGGYTYTNVSGDITGEVKNIVSFNIGLNYKF